MPRAAILGDGGRIYSQHMDRSYSVLARSSAAAPEPKRRKVAVSAPPVPSRAFTYFCVSCGAGVELGDVILCACGCRVVRKGKTRKKKTYICR